MLNTWNTFSSLDRLIDNVMSDVMTSSFGTATRAQSYSTPVDVRSSDHEIVFCFDVPGIKREDLEVIVENGTLTVKGERKYEYDQNEKVWLGRSYGAFTRSFQLPDDVDAEKLSAELADGVLTVKVAKHPKAQPRRIPIGGSAEPKQLEEKQG
jgi:HSP20 family protein